MFIIQLGTCTVTIEDKNNRKKCKSFVVPGNGQAFFGISDTAALKIINMNIDLIDAEDAQKNNCTTNTDTTKESNAQQEIHGVVKCCTNTDGIFETTNNSNESTVNTNVNTLTKYFLLYPNNETDKRKNTELTQQMHKESDNVFYGIGCFEGTFSLHLKPDSGPY